MAAARIVQHAILDAIQSVALVIDGVGQNMDLVRRNVTVAIHGQRYPEMAADIVMGPVSWPDRPR